MYFAAASISRTEINRVTRKALPGLLFVPQIESTGYNRGVPVVRTAAYPGAFANDTTEEQQRKAREVLYDQIVTAFTKPIGNDEVERIAGAIAGVNYDDIVFTGSFERVQQFYETSEMSDGLPVIPPTKIKAEKFLGYSPYNYSDTVAMVNGKAVKAYMVAANAIMAGCASEHLPFRIAFAQALSDGSYLDSLRSGKLTPMMYVNGPAAHQIGIDNTQGMTTEETNIAIGRFLHSPL